VERSDTRQISQRRWVSRKTQVIRHEPEISIAHSYGFNPRELSNIFRIVAKGATSFQRHGMSISATSARFDDYTMWVELTDGRTPGVPLAWFPRLLRATAAEREQVELSRVGLHWEALDEDISIEGLLAGRRAVTRTTEHVA
jgi:hypothetical protein